MRFACLVRHHHANGALRACILDASVAVGHRGRGSSGHTDIFLHFKRMLELFRLINNDMGVWLPDG